MRQIRSKEKEDWDGSPGNGDNIALDGTKDGKPSRPRRRSFPTGTFIVKGQEIECSAFF
jgi:hypothetical protein